MKTDDLKRVHVDGRVLAAKKLGDDRLLKVQLSREIVSVFVKRSSLSSTGEKVLRRIEIGDTIGVEGVDIGSSLGIRSINCLKLFILNSGNSNVIPIETAKRLVKKSSLNEFDKQLRPLRQLLASYMA